MLPFTLTCNKTSAGSYSCTLDNPTPSAITLLTPRVPRPPPGRVPAGSSDTTSFTNTQVFPASTALPPIPTNATPYTDGQVNFGKYVCATKAAAACAPNDPNCNFQTFYNSGNCAKLTANTDLTSYGLAPNLLPAAPAGTTYTDDQASQAKTYCQNKCKLAPGGATDACLVSCYSLTPKTDLLYYLCKN